jgi:hypothetical protein
MNPILRVILVILATVGVITVNGLANALPLNGLNTGEIADFFDIYFQPAGYVFSIWGLIYLGLIAYSIYQALPAQHNNPRLARIAPWYLLSSLANAAWIFLWHYTFFPLTLLVMLVLLGSLIAVYLGLRSGYEPISAGERWMVWLPFSIYLGWVSVATIANASAVFDYWGWQGAPLTPEVWTVIMLMVGALLGLIMVVREGETAFPLVLVWAFSGIAVRFPGVPLVSVTAWITAGLALVLAGVGLFIPPRTRKVGHENPA